MGDGIFANSTEGWVRIISHPDLRIIGKTGAHVKGLYAAALDPRGKYGSLLMYYVFLLTSNLTRRYLITGGAESIVNFFDLEEWLCVRTMSVGEYVNNPSF